MVDHTTASKWFLAQIKPNCVQIAKKNLTRQGFQTFLPCKDSTVQRRGRFTTTLQPLFPGYIFVALDVVRGQWRAVNSTYGITRLVSFSNRPAQVPDELIDELRARCDPEGKILPPPLLSPGDSVRLMAGPFSGFLASVEAMDSQQRVWVLMDIMGGQTRVGVDTRQLQAV